jgi:mono/diheme cytochrome c family protein
MRKGLGCGVTAVVFAGMLLAAPAADAPSTEAYTALLNKYCVGCHSEKTRTAGLALEKRDFSAVAQDAQVWEKVVRKLHAGAMPPAGLPRPENADVERFTGWLEASLDRAAAEHLNPGRTLIHRLNRTEYGNSIKDLLDIDVDATDLLPPDDAIDGFDNVAQMLTISPALLERYLSASAKITRLAVGDPAAGVTTTIYRAKADLSQDEHVDGLPIGTVGGLAVTHYFPRDGEYSFQPQLSRSILFIIHGLEERHTLEVTLDGARVKLVEFGGIEEDTRSHLNAAQVGDEIDARMAFKMRVTAGPHKITAAFLRLTSAQSAEVWQQYLRTALDANETKGAPHFNRIVIKGPYDSTGPGDTPSRRRIFVCHPAAGQDELPCARNILSTLARRAYRRPVTDNDMETLLTFYQQGRNKKTFDQGIESAMRRIISGPEFIFRTETDPPSVAPNTPYRISDLELASRLSFFLWSTIPDDQLFAVASQGKLHERAILEQQVRRMLNDPKSDALISNFASEWLQLRNLRGLIPDPNVFPDFDDNLRQAFNKETELLFGSILREDRNVTDLLTADYTFVNERLARHYGISGVYGDRFRRVPVTDDARRGLLGQGSILSLTSVATRTSPVLRGKWVLANLLGIPPTPPPPDVPTLKDNAGGTPLSMRDRMAQHRASPVCAGCHRVMDPIGFSLENFDALGQWRLRDGQAKIDATDTVYDGTKIDGAVGLRNFLLSRRPVFVQTMTEKLLGYGLGRGLGYYDMPAVRAILRDAARDDDRFSSIVMGIITSAPFQMRMKPVEAVDGASAALEQTHHNE